VLCICDPWLRTRTVGDCPALGLTDQSTSGRAGRLPKSSREGQPRPAIAGCRRANPGRARSFL
jgi:hypothetical protein